MGCNEERPPEHLCQVVAMAWEDKLPLDAWNPLLTFITVTKKNCSNALAITSRRNDCTIAFPYNGSQRTIANAITHCIQKTPLWIDNMR